jgi:HlyD family secretion protein/epimerase transport system membrane fusion protein
VRADLAIVLQKLRGSADVLRRTVVSAPLDGTVLSLKFKTIGGVIQRGEPIMEIVPADESLVVEARVTPLDVKAVHQGLLARVRLTAFSSRATPPVAGTVESISADRMLDQFTHEPYYLARISLDRQKVHELGPQVHLIAGMPVEVLIVVEQRTMFQYLSKPFRDAFNKSFLEL